MLVAASVQVWLQIAVHVRGSSAYGPGWPRYSVKRIKNTRIRARHCRCNSTSSRCEAANAP